MARPGLRLRALAVAQAIVLLVTLGAPIAALAVVDSVSPASLPQGATNQPVTITGSDFQNRCRTYTVTFSGTGVTATGVRHSSDTVMTAGVSVAADALLGPRDVTVGGSGRCAGFSFTGTGKFTVTPGGAIATKLAITSISPPSPTAGAAFSVTVQAEDAAGNPANVTSATGVVLGLSNGTGTLGGTLTGTIANGTSSVTISGVIYSKAEAGVVLTVTRTSGMSPLASGNSAPITVNAGAFTKLQLLVPGETAAPGTATGKTGTPTAQTAGVPFTVTVNAVDANWRLATSTHTVRITSSDPAATLPANAALAAGTRTFGVTLNSAGNRTVTATDVTDGSKTASTSPPISVVVPTAISLVRSRGMIAYGESVTFFVQLGANGGNRPFVLEYTSVGVPWTTIASLVTNAAGAAAFTYVPTRTGYVRARFSGAPDLGAATSPVLIVGVRQIVTLDPSHAGVMTIARGRSITFRSTVRPLRADLLPSIVTFRLYRNLGGAWVLRDQRDALTNASGVARTTFTFGQTGTWYVRAFAPRTPYNSISRYTPREYYFVR